MPAANPEDPIVYCNGSWVRQSKATVPFMDSGFWYGDGLFETLRVYNGAIFRPHKHLARMQQGLQVLQMDFPMPAGEVVAMMESLARRNRFKDALIRLMCTRGTLAGAPWKHPGPANLYAGFRFSDAEHPVPLLVRFVHEKDYPIGRMVPALKSMTYLGNMLAIRDAVAEGAFEPVFINRDGLITECAVRNIFFLQGNTLRTPDLSLGILPGVTRDLVLDLARQQGLEIDFSPIPFQEVNAMDEAFISSTGIGVAPCTWEGFQSTQYPLSQRLRDAVEAQIRSETTGH